MLASNFRSDADEGEAECTVGGRTAPPQPEAPKPENHTYSLGGPADEISPLATLLLVGLRSHASYWGHELEDESTVFGLVVRSVYAGDPVMA